MKQPFSIYSPNALRVKEVKVRTTSSAALFDVQTEYLYGLAEATEEVEKKSNIWKENQDVDQLRLDSEKKSFEKLSKEIEKIWDGIYQEYNK